MAAAASSLIMSRPSSPPPALSVSDETDPQPFVSEEISVRPSYSWPKLPAAIQHKISRSVAKKCIPFRLSVFHRGIVYDKKNEEDCKTRCLNKLRDADLSLLGLTTKQLSEIQFFLAHATPKHCAIRHIHGSTSLKHNNWLLQVAESAVTGKTLYEDITAKPDARPHLTFVVVYDDCAHASSIRAGTVFCIFYTTGK
jgi:hypothetical protein